MKPAVTRTLLAAALAASCLAGCGGAHDTGQTSPAAHQRDRDNDGDHNDDDAHVLDYGQEATGSERQALVKLITSYYAAAAAEDGARACKLLAPFVAETVAEDWGHSRLMQGSTCAQSMSKLFVHEHALLSGESATLKFVAVRVGEGHALDVLSFAVLPEVRQVTARLLEGRWWVLNLRDRILE